MSCRTLWVTGADGDGIECGTPPAVWAGNDLMIYQLWSALGACLVGFVLAWFELATRVPLLRLLNSKREGS